MQAAKSVCIAGFGRVFESAQQMRYSGPMRRVPEYIRRWAAGLMIAAVRSYQALLRPFAAGSCRYVPGCSEYFIEAVRLHGPARGMILGLRRILRCRPGGGWGYDPVPPARSAGGRPTASNSESACPAEPGAAE
jgi:putative membrane protein insertion efficiency factor